jgi:hypothetical protein
MTRMENVWPMAKYNRFDPRNKKKDRHKNQYLDRSSYKRKARQDQQNESHFEERMQTKYNWG